MELATEDPTAVASPGAVALAAGATGVRRRRGRTGRRLLGSLASLVLVLFLAGTATFFLTSLLPGDPAVAILGEGQPPERYGEVRQELGLNDPLATRYVHWLGRAVHGDLGRTLVPPRTDVSDRIASSLPVSLQLAVMAIGLSVVISLPLAMWSAQKPGGRVDRWVSAASFGALSVPSFLAGMLLILVFVRSLDVFPRAEWARLTGPGGLSANLRYAFLPVVTIALAEVAVFTRLLRDDLVSTLDSEFVAAARARGLSPNRVMLRHALRPSSFSFVTLAGVNLGRLIGSSVIVESVFALPGLGSLIVKGATQGDVTLVQGVVLVVALLYVIVNAVVDIGYAWLDPRIRRVRA